MFFYTGIIALAIFNLIAISGDLSATHISVVLTACSLWLACALTFHQLQLFIEGNSIVSLTNTLKILTIINLAFSLLDLLKVMLATHSFNPYSQISPPPYGISSGDLIGGVFGEMHLVNMSICAFLLVFFLYQKSFLYACAATLPLLLTGSNLGTLITIVSLLYILLVKRDLLIRYYILFTIALIVVFYIKVTPENLKYFSLTIEKVKAQVKQEPFDEKSNEFQVPTGDEISPEEIKNNKIHEYLVYKGGNQLKVATDSVYYKKQFYIRSEKKTNYRREEYRHYRKDSLQHVKEKDRRFDYGRLKKFDFKKQSGKVISFVQVKDYLTSDWRHFLFGSGPAGFSSRLAFISSGIVDDSRILMKLSGYENPEFTKNHKAIFKYLLFLDDEYHSITNLPFCWYNEVAGEYGITGTLLFILLYIGFFIKNFKRLSYGKVLLALILAFFLFDYWYQRLSVIVIFELLVLIDLKMSTEKEIQK